MATLEEIQAKTKAIEERRAKASAEREAAETLSRAEAALALAEALEKAEAEHGPVGRKLAVVHATAADGSVIGSVVVRVAPNSAFQRFKKELGSAKPGDLDAAYERLWRPLVVFPSLAEVDRLSAELPFLSTALADAVGRLCGIRSEELGPKF